MFDTKYCIANTKIQILFIVGITLRYNKYYTLKNIMLYISVGDFFRLIKTRQFNLTVL